MENTFHTRYPEVRTHGKRSVALCVSVSKQILQVSDRIVLVGRNFAGVSNVCKTAIDLGKLGHVVEHMSSELVSVDESDKNSPKCGEVSLVIRRADIGGGEKEVSQDIVKKANVRVGKDDPSKYVGELLVRLASHDRVTGTALGENIHTSVCAIMTLAAEGICKVEDQALTDLPKVGKDGSILKHVPMHQFVISPIRPKNLGRFKPKSNFMAVCTFKVKKDGKTQELDDAAKRRLGLVLNSDGCSTDSELGWVLAEKQKSSYWADNTQLTRIITFNGKPMRIYDAAEMITAKYLKGTSKPQIWERIRRSSFRKKDEMVEKLRSMSNKDKRSTIYHESCQMLPKNSRFAGPSEAYRRYISAVKLCSS